MSGHQRAPSPSFYVDPHPEHELPDEVPPEEAERRFERAYRFGTGGVSTSNMHSNGEAPPDRPQAPFDWTRYDHVWRDFEPLTLGQVHYHNMLANDSVSVVVALGAAGTGKTLLAVQEGLRRLRAGSVRKLIFTRPAVLAGEELGHLPGTEAQKLEPLLAPLLDSVTKIMGAGAWAALKNKNLLELQSFAYMRGRTHDDAFVVADEEQNASFTQLKLLATRLGTNAKLCILGDPAQPDRALGGNWSAPPGGSSLDLLAHFIEDGGMKRAPGITAAQAKSVAVARLSEADCQRSTTAATMLSAFGQLEAERPAAAVGTVASGASAGFMAFQQAVRSVVQQEA